MLARLWSNWTPHMLLVGIKYVATTLENSLAASYKHIFIL